MFRPVLLLVVCLLSLSVPAHAEPEIGMIYYLNEPGFMAKIVFMNEAAGSALLTTYAPNANLLKERQRRQLAFEKHFGYPVMMMTVSVISDAFSQVHTFPGKRNLTFGIKTSTSAPAFLYDLENRVILPGEQQVWFLPFPRQEMVKGDSLFIMQHGD